MKVHEPNEPNNWYYWEDEDLEDEEDFEDESDDESGVWIIEGGLNKGLLIGIGLKLILMSLLFGIQANNNYKKVCQGSNNKLNHVLYGNRSKGGNLSLFTWNKGNSTFSNRRNDIEVTIARYKPDIFTIHEANFNILNDRGFENYKIEANTLCKGYKVARTIVLIKDTLAYKRRKDLENDYISSVWIQVIISKKVSLLVSSYYRQWSLPKVLNFNQSNSTQNQLNRYQTFTNQVSKASKEKRDIMILTDENIDSLQDKSKSGYCNNIHLKNIRDQSIIENSLTYHNNKATFCRRGEAKLIDKLQTLLMKCTRPILGFKSYKLSTLQIMSDLRIQTVHHLIVRESIQFIHKVLIRKSPAVIFDLFMQSNLENVREIRKWRVKLDHKSSNVTNSLYYRAVYFYNCLENDIRNYSVKKLSKYLQDNITEIFPYNKVPKCP